MACILAGTLVGASCVLVAAAVEEKSYTKFQSLGFSIFTGPAPAINVAETLRRLDEGACDYTPENCPTDVWKLTNRILVCPACLVFNPECECDPDTMTCKYSASPLINGGCYLGDFDTERDIRGRISIMETAVQRAHEVSSKDSNTLKIFAAPEFFWRGPTGAYSFDSIADPRGAGQGGSNALRQISRGLEAIVRREIFADWLFVFGTIVAFTEKTNGRRNAAPTFEFLNFAPIYKGGAGVGAKFIAPKYYISGIDFLSNGRLSPESMTPDPAESQVFYDNSLFRQIQSWLEDEEGYQMIFNSWFFVDDIAFSLEICLDHSQGVAKFFLDSKVNVVPSGGDGTAPKPRGAQISLVSSAGMSITDTSLALLSGGTIFLQDGMYTRSQERTCARKTGFRGGYFCADTAYLHYELHATPEETRRALDGLFTLTAYAPQIHVYQQQDIVPMPAGALLRGTPPQVLV